MRPLIEVADILHSLFDYSATPLPRDWPISHAQELCARVQVEHVRDEWILNEIINSRSRNTAMNLLPPPADKLYDFIDESLENMNVFAATQCYSLSKRKLR